jgi:hypothetical protein
VSELAAGCWVKALPAHRQQPCIFSRPDTGSDTPLSLRKVSGRASARVRPVGPAAAFADAVAKGRLMHRTDRKKQLSCPNSA